MKRLRRLLALPLLCAFLLSDSQDLIAADVRRWSNLEGRSKQTQPALLELVAERKEFRNLIYHRLCHGNSRGRFVGRLGLVILHPEPTLRLVTSDIGPGLYLQHAISTSVGAEKIGANAWINQQVTIGVRIGKDGTMDRPVLEDGVTVCVGAIVIGDVRLGRGAVVGAGAVVTHDVPEGMVAVGPSAEVRAPGREASRAVSPLQELEPNIEGEDA